MPSTSQARYPGVIAIAAGVLTAVPIYLHPELLLVPSWVAYSACGAFVLAGLALVAQSASRSVAYRWLVVALVGSMLIPPLWAAFGTSSQSCSAAILGSVFVPTEVACRAVWGVSSLFLIVIFIMSVRWAVRGSSAG